MAQQDVSALGAERVIDLGEPVEVSEEQRTRGTLRNERLTGEAKPDPIRQSRQLVVSSDVLELVDVPTDTRGHASKDWYEDHEQQQEQPFEHPGDQPRRSTNRRFDPLILLIQSDDSAHPGRGDADRDIGAKDARAVLGCRDLGDDRPRERGTHMVVRRHVGDGQVGGVARPTIRAVERGSADTLEKHARTEETVELARSRGVRAP